MSRVRRVLYALSFAVLASILPVSTYAGGGAPVGGGGVGGGGIGGLVIMVDNMSPAHHVYAFLDYFPRNAFVHQGDVVTFRWANNANAFHTVSFLPAGVAPTDKAIGRAYPGGFAPDRDDGSQGGINLGTNGHVPKGCGNSVYFPGSAPCVFDGSAPVNSGLELPALNQQGKPIAKAPPATFTVRVMAKPGAYHWLCLIHGGHMNGTIHVVPAGTPIPSVAAQEALARRQYQMGARNAMAHQAAVMSHLPPPTTAGGHTTWSVLSGDQYGRVEIEEFMPGNLNVKPGDSVNWLPGFHTVTSPNSHADVLGLACEAPGRDRPFRGSFVGCDAETLLGQGALPTQSGQAHTGQPLNSGILVIPRPRAWAASFPSAATFKYECRIHAFMAGQVNIH